jgi:hypothetical protein
MGALGKDSQAHHEGDLNEKITANPTAPFGGHRLAL